MQYPVTSRNKRRVSFDLADEQYNTLTERFPLLVNPYGRGQMVDWKAAIATLLEQQQQQQPEPQL